MSQHAAPTVKPADDPAFQLPSSLSALSIPLCVGGLITLLAGWVVGNILGSSKVGMSAYLVAVMYCVTLSLGCLFFVMIQHLVRAGWSTVVRRIAELFMMMIIPAAVLFLPILVTLFSGEGTLYSWDKSDFGTAHGVDPDVWNEKSRWLTQGWFAIRAVIYFGVWAALAVYFYRSSTTQDETGELAATDRMQYWSGPAVMVFCLITTMAAFDWVMSLAPMWFSTMFGVYIFTGSVLSAHCLIAVSAFVLQKKGAMRDEVTDEHYHDLGKLIFGFTLFWVYISFSQYLLIWYANIPEETEWFFHRQNNDWWMLSIAMVFLHWLIPFLGTMCMAARRRPWVIVFWACWILVMHFVDIFWMVMPEAFIHGNDHLAMGVVAAVLCTLGMVALAIGLTLRLASGTKVVAVRDPRLAESIAFENI